MALILIKNITSDPDEEYVHFMGSENWIPFMGSEKLFYFMGSETLPTACYILSDDPFTLRVTGIARESSIVDVLDYEIPITHLRGGRRRYANHKATVFKIAQHLINFF